ncbi:hypothetical protein [Primorskyibacter sp. S187A]|uniref:hypothetical protein n=1 Tax=Primorskyibacter sp. S187A TaxID=3415130 RepID=UPI003C7DD1DE
MTPTLGIPTAPEAGLRIPGGAFNHDRAPAANNPPPAPAPTFQPDAPVEAPVIVEAPAGGGLGDFLLNLPTDIALIIVAAGCFFLGVVLACLMPGKTGTQKRETAVSAPMTFLITAGFWFPLLSGELIKSQIAPIDSILAFFIDDSARGQMFAFGIVMLFGYNSGLIFTAITRIFHNLLRYLESEAPKPPADPPKPAGAG